MTDQNDRLSVLEAEIARITGERDRERAAVNALALPPTKQPTGRAALGLKAQMLAVDARRRAHEEQCRQYEEQIARNGSQVAALEQQIRGVAVRQTEEQRRHRDAMAKLGAERGALADRVNDLMRPPAMPPVDYTEANAAARDANPEIADTQPVAVKRRRSLLAGHGNVRGGGAA